jgi:hypothetical protein
MKKMIWTSVMIATLLFLCGESVAQQTVKEKRDVSGFNGVGFGVPGNLYVKIGSGFDVTIEGNDRYVREVETFIRDGRLIIRRTGNFRFNNEKVDVYITMPEVKSLSVSGSGRAKVEGSLKTDDLSLSVSGSGKIELPSLTADQMKCSISGSGDITIENGRIGKAGLSISGSGSYYGDNAVIEDFDAGISGSGSCSCNVTENLSASISGSGNVVYSGNPRINVRASGSGRVRSK